MTARSSAFDTRSLAEPPYSEIRGTLFGSGFTARVAIPDYGDRVAQHYRCDLSSLSPELDFDNLGAVLDFAEPTELNVHDGELRLDGMLRDLLKQFGVVLLRNAYQPQGQRAATQRNVFSCLRFHVDRGDTQPERYSLFWRDPFDPVQRMPRSSSTLILPYATAYLQALAEGHGSHQFKLLYHLFQNAEVRPLIGKILFELPWQAPEGTGEIALLDNRRVLHASYYEDSAKKGYPISVRYLI